MTPSAEEIGDWIVARVSALTEAPPEEIDVRAPLTRHGLDSVAVIALAADLEKWLGYRFRSNPLDAHPTIEALARYLAAEVAKGRPA
ncbi:MAG: acyl carrier protein [Gemmataceae bacterium]